MMLSLFPYFIWYFGNIVFVTVAPNSIGKFTSFKNRKSGDSPFKDLLTFSTPLSYCATFNVATV